MAYMSFMVHLELGRQNQAILCVAGDLAERFGARVVGIAAAQPTQLVYGHGCYVPPSLINEDRDDTQKLLQAAEAEFRSVLQSRVKSLEWRSATGFMPLKDTSLPQWK